MPVQALNRGLFIDAEDGGVLGWVPVNADNVGSLGFKSGSLLAMNAPGDVASTQLPARRGVRCPC